LLLNVLCVLRLCHWVCCVFCIFASLSPDVLRVSRPCHRMCCVSRVLVTGCAACLASLSLLSASGWNSKFDLLQAKPRVVVMNKVDLAVNIKNKKKLKALQNQVGGCDVYDTQGRTPSPPLNGGTNHREWWTLCIFNRICTAGSRCASNCV
jgi:hypothetical protein